MKIAKFGSAALAVVGVGAAVLAATPAGAHGAPFTVTAGSAPVGTTVAATKLSGTVSFKDTTRGTLLTCTSSSIKGTLQTGLTNGRPFVTLNGASVVFTNCTGPAGLKFAITGVGTWSINIDDSTNGVSTGTVTNIRAHVQSTAGPNCGFDIGADSGPFTSSGTTTVAPATIGGSYTNSTQNVSIPATNPGRLGIWNVKGGTSNNLPYCISKVVLSQGDLASFSATYKLTADNGAFNPIAVT